MFFVPIFKDIDSPLIHYSHLYLGVRSVIRSKTDILNLKSSLNVTNSIFPSHHFGFLISLK